MYCHKCNCEYRDGINVCPECGDILHPEPPAKIQPADESLCLLCTASDEFEADIIISKLSSEGIPAFKKFKGSDSYSRIILGRTLLGVDIIISEKDLAVAKEIL